MPDYQNCRLTPTFFPPVARAQLHQGLRESWGMRLPGLKERLGSLGHGRRVLYGDPAADAALYPHVVALTRLLDSQAGPGRFWTSILASSSR